MGSRLNSMREGFRGVGIRDVGFSNQDLAVLCGGFSGLAGGSSLRLRAPPMAFDSTCSGFVASALEHSSF